VPSFRIFCCLYTLSRRNNLRTNAGGSIDLLVQADWLLPGGALWWLVRRRRRA
jgi:hypothetical protein